MKKYFCVNCGYIYDELMGDPERGIIRGTLVSKLSDSWQCPDCESGLESLCSPRVYDYERKEAIRVDRPLI